MSDTITGKLEVKNSDGKLTTILLDGGQPQGKREDPPRPSRIKPGKAVSIQGQASETPTLTPTSTIELLNAVGEITLRMMNTGVISVGGVGQIDLGDVPSTGIVPIELDGSERRLSLNGALGGGITLKAQSTGGEIRIGNDFFAGSAILRLGADAGGKGKEGSLFLCDGDGKLVLSLKAEDDGGHTSIWVGGNGRNGRFVLQNQATKSVIILDASTGEIRIPGGLHFLNNGLLRLGAEADGTGGSGTLLLCNTAGKETMRLDGEVGDIILQNADCAEEFEVAAGEDVEPGTVMILDDNGHLQPGYQAYDKRVAGVISGAGAYRPGIVLDKKPARGNRKPVALMGKVYCKADASYSPIGVGDLLTTSTTPGHAMKAEDPLRAFGSVIGKALRPLISGADLIPILIALQ